MSHLWCTSLAVCWNRNIWIFPPRSKLFFFPPHCLQSEHRGAVWCRWACARCAAVGALSLRFDNSRNALRWTAAQELYVKDCTLEKSDCPEPVSMRVLLSVLYPVLSLTIFGLYPSMVSFVIHFFVHILALIYVRFFMLYCPHLKALFYPGLKTYCL